MGVNNAISVILPGAVIAGRMTEVALFTPI